MADNSYPNLPSIEFAAQSKIVNTFIYKKKVNLIIRLSCLYMQQHLAHINLRKYKSEIKLIKNLEDKHLKEV
jgi:hypothetical protein